jgi:hypothetical protein
MDSRKRLVLVLPDGPLVDWQEVFSKPSADLRPAVHSPTGSMWRIRNNHSPPKVHEDLTLS